MAPMLESNYNNFTQVERSIADFFLNNKEELDFSAREIAKKLFVSEASLSRFAKKCGFRGYREFIYQYEECIHSAEWEKEVADSTKTVLKIYQEIINKAYNLMDEAQILRIIHYMKEAERVYACGKGSSGLAASEMESRFMRIGVDIDSLQDPDRMKMQAVFQDQRKLVFGLSLSGETKEVIYLLRESYRQGAKTVLLTASNMDGFGDFCDEVVLVPSLQYLNYGNLISPQFPILLMLDIIYYYYVNQDKYTKEILHDNTLWALKEGKIRQQRAVE
jgi:DNA-binding MurR/RpiR family transcriptional regulator